MLSSAPIICTKLLNRIASRWNRWLLSTTQSIPCLRLLTMWLWLNCLHRSTIPTSYVRLVSLWCPRSNRTWPTHIWWRPGGERHQTVMIFFNQKKTLSFNHVIFSDSTISQILNKLTVRVVSNEECVSTFGSIIQVTNMCAIGSVKASGTCQGDSGSSLQYAIDTKRWAQVGVVSFGSATGCADDHPNGYTRIAHYLGWISEVTGIIYD